MQWIFLSLAGVFVIVDWVNVFAHFSWMGKTLILTALAAEAVLKVSLHARLRAVEAFNKRLLVPVRQLVASRQRGFDALFGTLDELAEVLQEGEGK